MKERWYSLGTALSQLLHVVVTLGEGDPKMTTSARVGRQVVRGERWAIIVGWIISTIVFDHPDHCVRSYKADRARRIGTGHHDE